MSEHEPVIGIDLGTTNSVVATLQGATPVVIANRQGATLTPSVLALAHSGKILVGQLAKRQSVTNPTQTVYAAKRLIGRKFSSEETKQAIASYPFEMDAGEHDDIRVRLGDKLWSLPEISGRVLRELKEDADAYFGQAVRRAVITVPAYFNDGQRTATKDAGTIAGLEVLRIVNEPTAAALAFGLGKKIKGKVAVFDLGGGTFDISVLDVSDGVFEVKSTGGDTFLGGEDFDNRIIQWLADEFQSAHGTDLRKDRMALQRLKDAAENAKIELSTAKESQVNLPFICQAQGNGSALHLLKVVTREQLEMLCDDLIDRTINICDQVLKEANVSVDDLQDMVLVGGMTRMPKIQEVVRAYFRREPSKGVHPDEVVALGAAIHADALANNTQDIVLLDVTPQSLGVAIAGGYVRRIVPKNSSVPLAVTEAFSTSRDDQTTVKIMVIQGENELAHENELLGEFLLSGLRLARRGEVKVDVTFDINSEGIVSVAALDPETGQRQSIQVTASAGLTVEELKAILEEQADMLLDVRADEEVLRRQDEIREMLSEAVALLKQFDPSGSSESSRSGLLANMRSAVESAQRASNETNLTRLAADQDRLARALAGLKALNPNGTQ